MSLERRDEYADAGFRRLSVGVECGPGRVRASMKDECDINRIMSRYAKSGLVTHLAAGKPRYMDVSDVGDYRSLVERVARAEKVFLRLPAKVRASFQNSAAVFLDAVADPGRRPELEALGVLEPSKPPEGAGEGGGAPVSS